MSRVRAELLAARLQLGHQLDIIVDLAVEDQPGVGVGEGHGLEGGVGEVDDAQRAVGQADRPVEVEAVAVGAAVGERGGHALQQRAVGRGPPAIKHPRDSTHGAIIL